LLRLYVKSSITKDITHNPYPQIETSKPQKALAV